MVIVLSSLDSWILSIMLIRLIFQVARFCILEAYVYLLSCDYIVISKLLDTPIDAAGYFVVGFFWSYALYHLFSLWSTLFSQTNLSWD